MQIRPIVLNYRGSLYHAAKLHPGPSSNVGVRPRTDTQTQTRVTTTHLRRLRLTQNVMTITQINATENFNEDHNPSLTRPQKAHHTAYRSFRSVHPFLHSSPSYTATKAVCFTMLFNQSDTPKVLFSVGGIYTPCNTCSLDPPDSASHAASRSVQPFLHISRQRVAVLCSVR